jgi:hypothetical protein
MLFLLEDGRRTPKAYHSLHPGALQSAERARDLEGLVEGPPGPPYNAVSHGSEEAP